MLLILILNSETLLIKVEGDGLLCMCTSRTGELLGLGDIGGAVMVWGERENAIVNEYSSPTVVPTLQPPLVHIPPESDLHASAYYCQPPGTVCRPAVLQNASK